MSCFPTVLILPFLFEKSLLNSKQHKLFSQFQSSGINNAVADILLMTNALC